MKEEKIVRRWCKGYYKINKDKEREWISGHYEDVILKFPGFDKGEKMKITLYSFGHICILFAWISFFLSILLSNIIFKIITWTFIGLALVSVVGKIYGKRKN